MVFIFEKDFTPVSTTSPQQRGPPQPPQQPDDLIQTPPDPQQPQRPQSQQPSQQTLPAPLPQSSLLVQGPPQQLSGQNSGGVVSNSNLNQPQQQIQLQQNVPQLPTIGQQQQQLSSNYSPQQISYTSSYTYSYSLPQQPLPLGLPIQQQQQQQQPLPLGLPIQQPQQQPFSAGFSIQQLQPLPAGFPLQQQQQQPLPLGLPIQQQLSLPPGYPIPPQQQQQPLLPGFSLQQQQPIPSGLPIQQQQQQPTISLPTTSRGTGRLRRHFGYIPSSGVPLGTTPTTGAWGPSGVNYANMFYNYGGGGARLGRGGVTPSCSASYPPRTILNGEKAVSTCPTPPNWEQSLDLASTSTANTPFIRIQIESSSDEYKVLGDMLTSTPIHVDGIERVVNPDLWNRFVTQRKELLGTKSCDLSLLKDLGLDEKALELRKIGIKNFTRHPRVGAVEYCDYVALLYHCSRNGNIQDILEQGLDERLGGHGLLGRGIYFSDDPGKSVQYDSTSSGQLMIFGVLLGDCLSVTHLENTREFVREPKKVELQQRNRSDLFFDSIVGRVGSTYPNEFVIYNRNQCCPLYIISYKMRGQNYSPSPHGTPPPPISNDKFSTSRSSIPPCAWSPNETILATSTPTDWPFLAINIFKEMGVKVVEEKVGQDQVMGDIEDDDLTLSPPPSPPSPQPSTSRSCFYNRGLTTNVQRKKVEEVKGHPPQSALENDSPEELETKKPKTIEGEDCPICCETMKDSYDWENLSCCSAKLCIDCFKKLAKNGCTMSGVGQSWFKCPFCSVCNGIEIGSCPDGQMSVTVIPSSCQGYEAISNDSLCIEYYIGGRHQTFRRAYLPNVPQGTRVLSLLRVAWDRRLCFSIGTSGTTGRVDTVVWNIHHKTSLSGGVQYYGYPDPTYFDRVLEELKQYGIE